jgi:hypothetical protein
VNYPQTTREIKARAKRRKPGKTILELHGQEYVDRLRSWAASEIAVKALNPQGKSPFEPPSFRSSLAGRARETNTLYNIKKDQRREN